jgi:hypothetical protein
VRYCAPKPFVLVAVPSPFKGSFHEGKQDQFLILYDLWGNFQFKVQ